MPLSRGHRVCLNFLSRSVRQELRGVEAAFRDRYTVVRFLLAGAVVDGAVRVGRRHDLKSTQEVASGVLGRAGGGKERRRGAHVLFHGRAGWQPRRKDVGGSSHAGRGSFSARGERRRVVACAVMRRVVRGGVRVGAHLLGCLVQPPWSLPRGRIN